MNHDFHPSCPSSFRECVADLVLPSEWENVSSKDDECPSYECGRFLVYILPPQPHNCDRFQVFDKDACYRLLFQTNKFGEVAAYISGGNWGVTWS